VPSAPAPLAASLPRQSGAEAFRYSRRRGLRPRGGGQYRLSFSGCRVGPCRSGDVGSGACHLLSQSNGGAAVGRTKRGITSFTCARAAESVRRPGLARSSGDGRTHPLGNASYFRNKANCLPLPKARTRGSDRSRRQVDWLTRESPANCRIVRTFKPSSGSYPGPRLAEVHRPTPAGAQRRPPRWYSGHRAASRAGAPFRRASLAPG